MSTSYGGNSVRYELANTGTQSSYVTKLQARGRFIAIKEPVLSDVQSACSIADFGESTLRVNMDYQDDPLVGADAEMLCWPSGRIPSMSLRKFPLSPTRATG